MSVFNIVKDNISARQVAEAYGVKVGRNGMACCPFHPDKNPSMKLDKRYYCFGCGETGDAIDFVSKYFGLAPWDSAVKICEDFGLRYDEKTRNHTSPLLYKPKVKKPDDEIFREVCGFYLKTFYDYRNLLEAWKEKYKPKIEDVSWHPYFIEALREITYTEYLIDILKYGDIHERAFLISEYEKEIFELEKRISRINTGGNEES